jgi:hypothetical protein
MLVKPRAPGRIASNGRIVTRLLVAGGMIALMLLALAYWWLENLPHELFGTVMFVLLGRHLYSNRRWFVALFRGSYDRMRVFAVALHLALVVNVAILLVTSVIISKSVFSFLPIPDSVTTREIHWFSAYWVMIIVGVHLGLQWTRVMTLTRSLFGLSGRNAIRTWLLRIAAGLCVMFGVWSFSILGIWTKLTFNYSLDFWNFNASVLPFFAHWAGVIAVPALIAHYTVVTTRSWRKS